MAEHLQAEILKAVVAEENDISMDVVVHESIESTNSWALQQCKTGAGLPFACFAEAQTQGRGRRGKSWLMPAYSNIAMSVAWPFALSYRQLNLLPLTIAMAIVETLESFKLNHVQVKWPNDVYVQGKKIAGILIETQPVKNKQIAMVVGVGLNYDMASLKGYALQDLPVFTDVCEELNLQTGKIKCDRLNLASTLLHHIVRACQTFQHDEKYNLEKFRAHYDYCKDKSVDIILDDQQVLMGVAQGVNDKAELLVMIDGEERAFNSAEVSVKAEV